MTQALLTDLRSVVDPGHTAVLVIDVQNDFWRDGPHRRKCFTSTLRVGTKKQNRNSKARLVFR